MIDTHCHLTDSRLGSQLSGVLARAEALKVTRFITVGTDLEDDRRAIALCQSNPIIRCACGVHPLHVNDVRIDDLPQLRDIHADPSVLAVGETGLDYHYDKSNRLTQIEFFEFQLALAAELHRPVVVHCREAFDDCLAVMKSAAPVRAVVHCFTGTASEAKRVLDRGYFLGFTGVLTFKNADNVRDALHLVPADRILIETDAPYLAPEPHRREKVNEPAWVSFVAKKVAELKGWSLAETDERTTTNARSLFGWPC